MLLERGPLREYRAIYLQFPIAHLSNLKFESHLGVQFWDWLLNMNTSLEPLHLDLKLASNNPGGLLGGVNKPTHLPHMT